MNRKLLLILLFAGAAAAGTRPKRYTASDVRPASVRWTWRLVTRSPLC